MIEKEVVKLECLPLELPCPAQTYCMLCVWQRPVLFLKCLAFLLWQDIMLKGLRRSGWCCTPQSRVLKSFAVLQMGPSEMQLACKIQILNHGSLYFSKL